MTVNHYTEKKMEHIQNKAGKLNLIVSNILQKPKAKDKEVYDFLLEFNDLQGKYFLEIMEQSKINKEISEFLDSLNLEELNEVTSFIGMLLIFLKHPEYLEKLQEMF